MPQFTVTGLTRCAGGNHVRVAFTVAGQARTVDFLRSELDLEPEEAREAFLSRLRSAVKEAGASTPAQIQTALVGKTFSV